MSWTDSLRHGGPTGVDGASLLHATSKIFPDMVASRRIAAPYRRLASGHCHQESRLMLEIQGQQVRPPLRDDENRLQAPSN